jgi:Zn-finger protein
MSGIIDSIEVSIQLLQNKLSVSSMLVDGNSQYFPAQEDGMNCFWCDLLACSDS